MGATLGPQIDHFRKVVKKLHENFGCGDLFSRPVLPETTIITAPFGPCSFVSALLCAIFLLNMLITICRNSTVNAANLVEKLDTH